MRIVINIFVLLLLISGQVMSQDINFSQFYELPMLRNPALAGVFTGDIRVQSVYRNQWQSITVPYKTMGASVEMKFPAFQYDFITLGTQITYDVAGDSKLTRSQLLPVLNYHKSLNDYEDMYLNAAFMGGLISNKFDPTGLTWDDQYSGGQYVSTNPTREALKNTGRNYFDIGMGLSFSSPVGDGGRYYVGSGLYHINRPSVTFGASDENKLDRKWVFNSGISYPTDDFSKLIFYGDYFLQGAHKEFVLGGFYATDLVDYGENDKIEVKMGLSYRWNDALTPAVNFNIFHWGIGVSYDVNVSKLSKASQLRGGFEFTLSYLNFLSNRNPDLKQVKCVGF